MIGQDGSHPGPVGAYFGRRDCSAMDCFLENPRGGAWFWRDRGGARKTRNETIVKDDAKVFFVCGDKPIEVVHCVAGNIVPSYKHFDCTCQAIEEDDDSINCPDVDSTDDNVEGGSACFKMCKGEVFEKSACQDGEWTIDLNEVKCPRDILEGDVDALSVIFIMFSVIVLCGLLLLWVMRKVLLQASIIIQTKEPLNSIKSVSLY